MKADRLGIECENEVIQFLEFAGEKNLPYNNWNFIVLVKYTEIHKNIQRKIYSNI